jgi:DUF4097 and DUF4098 domain-containing protein YvlB
MKENVKKANDFSVYPNPANTAITIEWNGNKDASFRILDLNGKEVMSNNELSINSQINVESLNSGLYFIEMVDAGKTITKKINIIR